MGRRSRTRRQPPPDRLDPPPPASQTARVRVTDEMWQDFRQACGHRPASEVLGRYVEAEVSRWLDRKLTNDNRLTDDELAAAVRRLDELERSCRSLVDRLMLRLRT